MRDGVDFLPADKHESFLLVDGITLGVFSLVCPKYPKQQVYNIFAVSQGKREGRVDFLHVYKHERFLSIILDMCGQACPNYRK